MLEGKINILIIGAGKGGSLLTDLFYKSETVNILGVVDINADAPGIKLAIELGIPTGTDYKKFLNQEGLHEIINVTGSEKVQEELLRLKPLNVEVIGGHSAKLIWDVVEEHKLIEEQVIRRNTLLNAINEVFRETLTCETEEEVARICLVVAEELTKSKFGFINEVNRAGLLDTIAISDPGWKECRMPKSDAVMLLKDMKIHSYYGRVIKEGKSQIVNDPSSDPDRVGIPEGHPQINCFMGVPLKQMGRAIGLIGLANKETGYTLADQQDMEILSLAFVEALKRKRTEETLKESNIRLQTLIQAIPDVVYFKDAQGRNVVVNKAFEDLVGLGQEEIVGKTDEQILPPDLAEYCKKSDEEVMRTRKPFLSEEKYTKEDGENIFYDTIKSPLYDDQGNAIGIVGVSRDITSRKKLEEQLLQAQKMEAIGQLAGGIAHDFNNILTAIIGFGNLLKIEASNDDLLKSYVTHILNSAERAANLTQALLAFSRRQIISPKPVNLNKIIRGLENLLSRIIGEDIEFSTVFIDQDITVMVDSGQIEQVMMNLTTNARDAMPDGGSLIIKTEAVRLDDEFIKVHGYGKPGLYALVSVEDTGEGMNEETKARIFEPFFTTKGVGKGTGLGLSIVYGIIKQHDGYINVYSEPGRGTTFKIYLPLIKSKVEEVTEAALLTIKRGTETVLIAEDDAQVRALIKELLGSFGYTVLEAKDGEDAIRVFHENREGIQLLILDVIMPKKNGKDVYDEIRKVRPDTKVIFTSGYDNNVIHKKGVLEERLDFISKPILPDKLLRKVREVLDRRNIR
jgi:PAS domain S-box-containing protein